jgi:SAM-dependent methyltransferase
MININIENFLQCPSCFKSLIFNKKKTIYQCSLCREIFYIKNNIPILVSKYNSVYSKKSFLMNKYHFFSQNSRLADLLKPFIPEISHNLAAQKNLVTIKKFLHKKNNFNIVNILVIGSGFSKLIEDFFSDDNRIQIINVDISFTSTASIVCDAHNLPFKKNSFDLVIIQAVIEHVYNPRKVVNESWRVLKLSGLIYSETPFMQQVHGGNFDFSRFTRRGHRMLFSSFSEIDSGLTGGPGMAFAWSWQYLLLAFSIGKRSKFLLLIISRFTGFFWKYLDFYLVRNKNAELGASGFYFLGKKRENALRLKKIIFK